MKNFHGIDVKPSKAENALFHIIPVPLEQSVSYGTGTSKGPLSIIKASEQLELFDGKSCPYEYGIHTKNEMDCSSSIQKNLDKIKDSVKETLEMNKLPIIIGGEHTITFGTAMALKEKFKNFGIVQFDAHSDLRDIYEGNKFSHACVMRRISELRIPFVQIGTRSYSLEEQEFRKKYNLPYLDAEEINKKGISAVTLPENFPEKIFITIDIDVLDTSIMPATGTPVPGGLNWYQLMWLLEKIINERICIGFDLVEFSPIADFHGYEFSAAQIIYNTMGFIARNQKNIDFYGLNK